MVRNMEKDQQLVRSVWPEWELTDLIGFGTFGRVHKAYRYGVAADTFSAIKIIMLGCGQGDKAACADDTPHLAGIVRNRVSEVQKLNRLGKCPNIVEIQDVSVCRDPGGMPKMILIRTELLKSLYDDLDGRKITDQYVIQIGVDLCRALEACSVGSVAYCDIRPDNVYVNGSGVYKLGFDLTSQMRECISDTAIMTTKFVAPEVINKSVDKNDFERVWLADIYSLGMLLYWIANGRTLPFLGHGCLHTMEEYEDAFQRKMNGEELPPPFSVSVPLQEAILKGCAYDPLKRYRTAGEFRETLERIEGFLFPGYNLCGIKKTP